MPFSNDDPNINRKGRPSKGESWAEIIREVSEKVDPLSGKKFKYLVVKALFNKAIDGDIQAIKEIGNRIDGKSPQALITASKDDKVQFGWSE
jgi:hypothetical protein